MKNSHYSENELLEIASMFNKHLKTHFSALKNSSLGLDQGFIFRFKALYYDVHNAPPRPDKDTTIQSFNRELNDFADQVRELFPIFRFYMQKAFPYNSAAWEDYGYCEIEKVVRDYASLRRCLESSVKQIEEKRSELKAANCPEPTLNEIVGLAKQIGYRHDALNEYLEKIESRNKAYKNRINELYHLMQIVDEVASKSLQQDPESLKYLTFPTEGHIH